MIPTRIRAWLSSVVLFIAENQRDLRSCMVLPDECFDGETCDARLAAWKKWLDGRKAPA